MKKLTAVVLCLIVIVVAVYFVASSMVKSETVKPIVTDSNSITPDSVKNKNFVDLKDFAAQTLDGNTFTADNFKGHDLTIINIWGTYCAPCREEMPQIGEFSQTLPERIQFITICVDANENKLTAKSILTSAGFKGETLISVSGDLLKLYKKIQYVPTTLFFDENGNCVGREIIGGQSNVSASYTQAINSILTEMGKDTL